METLNNFDPRAENENKKIVDGVSQCINAMVAKRDIHEGSTNTFVDRVVSADGEIEGVARRYESTGRTELVVRTKPGSLSLEHLLNNEELDKLTRSAEMQNIRLHFVTENNHAVQEEWNQLESQLR